MSPLRDWWPPAAARRIAVTETRLGALEERVAALEARATGGERRVDGVEEAVRAVQESAETAIRALQDELAELRDRRAPELMRRLDRLEGSQHALEGSQHALEETTATLRDQALPAASSRFDVLVERLARELDELASLVERCLQREPLPAPRSTEEETAISAELARVQPLLVETFRGSATEIRHRLERYLAELAGSPPVLDLGAGRGELLDLLREAGVEARGVEADRALAEAARRRGLEVEQGDVLERLEAQPDGHWGAVTAFHLFEHLPSTGLLRVLAEVHRVLRPGGLLVVESPNPHSLRVGGSLFWLDPTHQRPLMPETLELFLRASGFVMREVERLHPFPAEQLLANDCGVPPEGSEPAVIELGQRLERLATRLDALLNAPRDVALIAVRPGEGAEAP